MIKDEDDYPQLPEAKKVIQTKDENKKESKEETNILKKYISSTLYELNDKEKNSNLDLMLNDLANFKHQQRQLILSENNVNKENYSSKSILYYHLEKYLMEISYISDKEKRGKEINKIYQWYKEKRKVEKDIQTITYKSYKEKNVIDEKEYFLNKKYQYKTLEVEKDHRNLELINKKMLNDYERKKLSKPFWALRKSISSQTIGSQGSNLSTANFTRNKFEKEDLQSIYSITKGTNNHAKKIYNDETISYIDKVEGGLLEKDYIQQNNPFYFDANILLPPVDKETKFSYSYLRPMYDLDAIFLENKIIEEKNRLIALKRNQEEINKKLKEFSLFRAKLKENLNNKFEMKNLVNLYVNKNNLSSFLLKKYKIKESEKQSVDTKTNNELKNLNSTEINNRKSCNLSLNNFNSEKVINNKIKEDNSNYSNSNIKSESSEKKVEARLGRSNSYYKKFNPNMTPKINLFDLSEEKNKGKNESTKNFTKNFRLSLSKKFSLKKMRKSISKRNSNMAISKFFPLKLFSGNNEKIKTAEVQNLENDSKTIKYTDNTQTKEYKIKFPQEKSNKELLKKNKEEKKYDTIPHILANDTLNKEKLLYKQLCKINTANANSDYIESDINQKTKWNLLNKSNVEAVNKILLNKVKRRNEFIKLSKRYNAYKHNLLSMRQSMSNDKRIQYQKLVDKIKIKKLNDYDEDEYEITELESNKTNVIYNYKLQNKNDRKNISLLNALVNPKDSFNYSKFYLPRNGSMLLSRDKVKKFFD